MHEQKSDTTNLVSVLCLLQTIQETKVDVIDRKGDDVDRGKLRSERKPSRVRFRDKNGRQALRGIDKNLNR